MTTLQESYIRKRCVRLFLEDDEYIFETSHGFLFSVSNPDDLQRLLQSDDFVETKLRGKIYFTSGSLLFVPDEKSGAIFKLPFESMQAVEDVSDRTLLHVPNTVAFNMSKILQMNEDFVQTNYIERTSMLVVLSPIVEDIHRFMENISHFRAIYDDKKTANEEIRKQIEDFESKRTFDAINLLKYPEREKMLFKARGMRALPSFTLDGMVVLTNYAIYFQTAYDEELVDVFPLDDVLWMNKYRFQMGESAVEIFLKAIEWPEMVYPSLLLDFRSKYDRSEFMSLVSAIREIDTVTVDGVIKKWKKNEMSNLDMLLHLNFLANRSFNELGKYPVVPWVIADYESETIDFDNTDQMRDLSKPVGALNEERLNFYRERYETMDGPPKFFYGSHYSTPHGVIGYLMRSHMEVYLHAKDGVVDVSDRLFQSIKMLHRCGQENTSDVKELIPEFYSGNGDFLINKRKFSFNRCQDGSYIDDVELPVWAKDVEHFINTNRAALECEYVTSNIHNWIDLVFGYKRSGRFAVKFDNLFFYLTYPEAIDLDLVENEREKAALVIQAAEFGQIPYKLFVAPLPPHGIHIFSVKELEGIYSALFPEMEKEVVCQVIFENEGENSNIMRMLLALSPSPDDHVYKHVPLVENESVEQLKSQLGVMEISLIPIALTLTTVTGNAPLAPPAIYAGRKIGRYLDRKLFYS